MPLVIGSINDLALTGEALATGVQGHVDAGQARLIARWADRPNVQAMLRILLTEVQELEDAIWLTVFGRTIEYAEGPQLDMLGRIVGELRNGLGDDAYRARVSVRIAINNSLGRPRDVIGMLRLLTDSRFWYRDFGTAAFRVDFGAPPEDAGIGSQIGRLIGETRAAGVSGAVYFPVDRATGRGAFFGSAYSPTLNAAIGFSSSYDPTVGGLWSHASRA